MSANVVLDLERGSRRVTTRGQYQDDSCTDLKSSGRCLQERKGPDREFNDKDI